MRRQTLRESICEDIRELEEEINEIEEKILSLKELLEHVEKVNI